MLFARAQLTQILNGTVRGPELRRELRRARAYARRVTAAARDDKDPRAYRLYHVQNGNHIEPFECRDASRNYRGSVAGADIAIVSATRPDHRTRHRIEAATQANGRPVGCERPRSLGRAKLGKAPMVNGPGPGMHSASPPCSRTASSTSSTISLANQSDAGAAPPARI